MGQRTIDDSSESGLFPKADPEIPNKLYFRIGEVAKLAGVKPYVLRFWESEFSELGPKKSGAGHRLYRRKDVELVLEIKHLLYQQRYTIEGARKAIEDKPHKSAAAGLPRKAAEQGKLFSAPGLPPGLLIELRRELESLVAALSEPK